MAVGVRQVRGVALIACALLAVVVASFAYLRPPTAVVTTSAPATFTDQGGDVQWTQPDLVLQINLPGRTNGGYFEWNRALGESASHGR